MKKKESTYIEHLTDDELDALEVEVENELLRRKELKP